MKLKKGTRVAHVMMGNVVPPMLAPKLDENILEGAAGNTPKSKLNWNPPKSDGNRLQKLFENLDLSGTESWTE